MKRIQSVCVSSGKGGVGKTLSSIGLALSLQKMGHKTVLIDGDLNLANIDVLFGVNSSYTVFDLLDHKVTLSQVLCRTKEGLKILPSSSGISKVGGDAKGLLLWSRILTELNSIADIAIMDAGAGLGKEVMTFNTLADLNLIVTTPDPHAITDAYALIKTLQENSSYNKIALLTNQCSSDFEGREIFERIRGVCEEFLSLNIIHAGVTKDDSGLARLVRHQNQGIYEMLKTNAGQSYCRVATEFASLLLPNHEQPESSFEGNLAPLIHNRWERSA